MSFHHKGPCRYLGTLQGSASLSVGAGRERLGDVVYEIDGYSDGAARWANGQVEGDVDVLDRAFAAGSATLSSPDGVSVQVVLLNAMGGAVAAIDVTGGFPL
jgi:hypothetical protein